MQAAGVASSPLNVTTTTTRDIFPQLAQETAEDEGTHYPTTLKNPPFGHGGGSRPKRRWWHIAQRGSSRILLLQWGKTLISRSDHGPVGVPAHCGCDRTFEKNVIRSTGGNKHLLNLVMVAWTTLEPHQRTLLGLRCTTQECSVFEVWYNFNFGILGKI
jgi:hypothetical protein